jgi:hypothetical protein
MKHSLQYEQGAVPVRVPGIFPAFARSLPAALILFSLFTSCGRFSRPAKDRNETRLLAREVREETGRTWAAYRKYAWGHDNLLPISGGFSDWYGESLSISPIDAYSTLRIMGFEEYANEIESYVIDSLDLDRDIFVKTFEVNIRILGGLLSMYDLTGDERILARAVDFGDRLLPAFGSATGIPRYWVNLHTGEARGDTVNVAEGGSCLLEMGILSLYSGDPGYYRAAKKASTAIFNARSALGLISESIDVETGRWTTGYSHIGCCIDSYYEYLYKGWVLFRDPDLKSMWDASIGPIQEYLADGTDSSLWYGKADMNTGERVSSVVTLYDAYFPALLALSGDTSRAARAQLTWDRLWNRYGLEPMVCDYRSGEILNPKYNLNPEIIESAYYLLYFTGDEKYLDMIKTYYRDIRKYCRTDIAYAHISSVLTMEKSDAMSTYFLAETMKYIYLAFSPETGINPGNHVFSTEAHIFRKSGFTDKKLEAGPGIKPAGRR